jgi:hypothetical protein
MHAQLRLPILFFASPDVADSFLCTDETAIKALRILGEISEMRTVHEGKCRVSRPIVYAIVRHVPPAVQIVMGA